MAISSRCYGWCPKVVSSLLQWPMKELGWSMWWFLNVRYMNGYNHILTYLRQNVESIWIWWHFICIQVLWAAIRCSSVLAQGKHGKRYLRTFGRKVSNTFPCSLKTDFFRFIALIYNHLIRPQKHNSHLFWTNSTFPQRDGYILWTLPSGKPTVSIVRHGKIPHFSWYIPSTWGGFSSRRCGC